MESLRLLSSQYIYRCAPYAHIILEHLVGIVMQDQPVSNLSFTAPDLGLKVKLAV